MGLNRLQDLERDLDRAPQPAALPAESPYHTPIKVIWQRRRTVIAVALAGCLGAAAYCIFATPIYTASSRIIATSDTPRGISSTTKDPVPENLYTELSIVTSSTILSDASALLDDPQWYWDHGYDVLVNGEKVHDSRVLLPGKPLPVDARRSAPAGSEVVRLRTFEGPGRLAYLRRKLQAGVGKDDQIITVSLDSPYSAEAPIIVNAVVDAYLNFSYAQKHGSADDMVRALQQKHDEFQREITSRNQAVTDIVRQNPMFYLNEGKSNPIQQRVDALSAELTTVNLEMLNARQAYDDAAAMTIHDPETLKTLIDTGTYDDKAIDPGNNEQEMLNEVRYAQNQLSELRRSYLEAHPAVQAAAHRLAEVNAAHVLFLHHQYKLQQDRVTLFQAQFDEANKAAQDLSVKLAEYEAAKSDLLNTNKLMQALETRIKEIHVDDGPTALTLKVLEPAGEPQAPSKPVKLLVLFEGLMAGSILGIGLTFIDRRLRSVDEVAATVQLPILSVVPRMPRRTSDTHGRVFTFDPIGDVAEAFRALRGAVALGRSAKTILVTSAIRGEGKSTVASNLAISLAEAGQRVLLVDADLRKPVQHNLHALGGELGLSDLLQGEADVNAATLRTTVKNLDLMPCGTMAPNPGELLDTDLFAELLASLSSKYNYVVLDSPPVLVVTDARILASMADMTLLVVRAEKTTWRAAMDARDGLLGFGANVVGVVVNAGKRRRDSYGYYGNYGRNKPSPAARSRPVPALPGSSASPHAAYDDTHDDTHTGNGSDERA